MEIKKSSSLYSLFLHYLTLFCIVGITLIMLFVFIFYFALKNKFILSANYSELAIQKIKNQLIIDTPFDSSLIPFTCTYTLFDKNGKIKSSNIKKGELEDLNKYLTDKLQQSKYQYVLIERNNNDKLIIKYDVLAHFSNPKLHKLFPNPELILLLISFSFLIIVAIFISIRFSKKLKVELSPIIKATNAIKEKDLDFDVVSTHIREFNTVLQSIDNLKLALSTSLKEQWKMERNKNFQISAIAHDIKTPITIIKGNSELLLETYPSPEDRILLEYIKTSSEKIEKYSELLIASSFTTEDENCNKDNIYVLDFVEDLINQSKALCKIKNITLHTEQHTLPKYFYGDKILINRAVLNIIDNAIQHSPNKSTVVFKIIGISNSLSFIIIDCGIGFTANGLKYATNKFYTQQTSRSGTHYGLGLHIAKMVAKKYNGKLTIENKNNNKGAKVSLILYN